MFLHQVSNCMQNFQFLMVFKLFCLLHLTCQFKEGIWGQKIRVWVVIVIKPWVMVFEYYHFREIKIFWWGWVLGGLLQYQGFSQWVWFELLTCRGLFRFQDLWIRCRQLCRFFWFYLVFSTVWYSVNRFTWLWFIVIEYQRVFSPSIAGWNF